MGCSQAPDSVMRTSSTIIGYVQIDTVVVIARFYSGELGPKHLNIKISNYAGLDMTYFSTGGTFACLSAIFRYAIDNTPILFSL